MGYDYVKGYKSGIEHLPKEIRGIVKEKLIREYEITEEEIDFLTIEVDTYISVDIRNYYDKK